MMKLPVAIMFLCSINLYSQTKINSIRIEGNNYLTYSNILDLMVSKKDGNFDRDQFKTDLKTIRDKYKSLGFLFMKFSKENLNFADDSAFVDIDLDISEGNKVTIGKIDITGNTALSESQLMRSFETKPGDVLNDKILNEDIADVLKHYEKIGLPFARINVKDISVYRENNDDKIRIELEVTENSKVRIDQIKIKGNETTKDYVILREIDLGKNKTINSKTLEQIKDRLDRLNIFETVSDPKVYLMKNKNESGLLIEVTEGNTNTFDGVIGYNPPSGSQSGYFTGLVNVSFRNLFGTARKLEAKYQQEVRETQELEFRYFEPYLFSLPLNMNFAFLQRIQDTTYTKRNLDIKADLIISDKITVAGLGGYERIIPSDNPNSALVIADSRIFYAGTELRFDNRDDIYIPSKGFLYRSSYSYGSKKIFNYAQLQNLGYQQSYSIQKYYIDLDFYSSFFKRQTTLLRVFGGEVKSDKLEDGDYFRIGGNKYIRGYRNEQFLASQLAISNFELRYAISRRGFLFGFFDSGYYFKPEDTVNHFPEQSGFLYGFGLGIRLETGLGLIGVSYALGKDDDLLDGKINFGLVNDF